MHEKLIKYVFFNLYYDGHKKHIFIAYGLEEDGYNLRNHHHGKLLIHQEYVCHHRNLCGLLRRSHRYRNVLRYGYVQMRYGQHVF